MDDVSRREVLRQAVIVGGGLVSGCLGAGKTRLVGQSVNLDGVSLAVTRVVVGDRIQIGQTGFSPMLGRVFIAPVLRIENATESSIVLPRPDEDISVRYRYYDANYGPFYRVQQEMGVGDERFQTYASAYAATDGELASNEVVWGIGPPHELPLQFDRSETSIRIRGVMGEYDWSFE